MPKITSIYQHEDKNFVFSVSATRDSKYIAASLKDKSVILFDLEKAEMAFVFEGFHESKELFRDHLSNTMKSENNITCNYIR